MKNFNEEMIVEEILSECDESERDFIELNKKLFIKVYKEGLRQGFNFAQ